MGSVKSWRSPLRAQMRITRWMMLTWSLGTVTKNLMSGTRLMNLMHSSGRMPYHPRLSLSRALCCTEPQESVGSPVHPVQNA